MPLLFENQKWVVIAGSVKASKTYATGLRITSWALATGAVIDDSSRGVWGRAASHNAFCSLKRVASGEGHIEDEQNGLMIANLFS